MFHRKAAPNTPPVEVHDYIGCIGAREVVNPMSSQHHLNRKLEITEAKANPTSRTNTTNPPLIRRCNSASIQALQGPNGPLCTLLDNTQPLLSIALGQASDSNCTPFRESPRPLDRWQHMSGIELLVTEKPPLVRVWKQRELLVPGQGWQPSPCSSETRLSAVGMSPIPSRHHACLCDMWPGSFCVWTSQLGLVKTD
jgi:hypothetical protein